MQKFDTLVALIFSRLFLEFPEPVRLNADSFLDDVIDQDDEEGSFNFIEYFWHTVDWLVAEGYIRITADFSSMDGKSYEVVLTQKGLQSLRKVPDSLQGSESLGERLVEFSKNKGSEAVGTLISLAINTASSAIVS
ncbi:hypothetical protein [Amphritea sp.]|uniref:hypothetical protein n=1 Tax=Amphritea sp. TaxID=1872502 RepID=UPI003D0DDA3F